MCCTPCLPQNLDAVVHTKSTSIEVKMVCTIAFLAARKHSPIFCNLSKFQLFMCVLKTSWRWSEPISRVLHFRESSRDQGVSTPSPVNSPMFSVVARLWSSVHSSLCEPRCQVFTFARNLDGSCNASWNPSANGLDLRWFWAEIWWYKLMEYLQLIL